MRYDKLFLCSLDKDQHARTCGYWYTVTTNSTSLTAFRTKAALLLWLGEHGIKPTAHIPDEGEHSCQHLIGAYKVVYADQATFYRLAGVHTAAIHNGKYRPAVILHDDMGERTVYIAHFDGAPELDYKTHDRHYNGGWGEARTAAIA